MSSPKAERRARVLILIKGLGIGGAEVLISAGAEYWDRDRFEYSVAYVLPWKNQMVPDLEARGVPVFCVGGRRGLGPTAIARFRRLVARIEPDLIHAHLPSMGVMSRLSTGLPTVYTEHNIANSYREPTKTINRLTYKRNTKTIAVSEAVAESLAGFGGPPPQVVPNGVAPPSSERGGARDELALPAETKMIVHVGNIRPHKGHANLISAAGLMKTHNVQIVSIGGEKHDGDLARVRNQALIAGARDKIRFLGRRTDARRFINEADVFVNPSDVEGLPVSILEAMASAKPVVATAVGGVPSVVRHEVTGLLVPPDDPQALADALDRSLTDPAASTWGMNGARRVAEHHSIDRMIRSYEAIYRETLNE